MRYEGNIFRPPSEARSLIIQVTIGCTHNKCTFCSMYQGKNFRVRDVKEVFEDILEARKVYRRVDRVFLADGDALCLSTEKLKEILTYIKDVFPECERISVYGTPWDVNRKTKEDLEELRRLGLGFIYIGAESGSEKVLKDINKGATRQEIIDAVKKIEAAGIKASVTFISGMGGMDDWKEHALETASMVSEMGASYVGLLTLMVEPGTEIYSDIQSGKFKLLSAEHVVQETALMLENIEVKSPCVFRSNHASNYVSLRGNLPEDKGNMLKQLYHAMENIDVLKDERFRLL